MKSFYDEFCAAFAEDIKEIPNEGMVKVYGIGGPPKILDLGNGIKITFIKGVCEGVYFNCRDGKGFSASTMYSAMRAIWDISRHEAKINLCDHIEQMMHRKPDR